ncbi:AarF/ABC1/UbiB kinase family protein [candidate division WOR-3 bacterium]|nr:AarF/ABC1/UbiB kinase family protein [candidate division WOR-3 bacterium]
MFSTSNPIKQFGRYVKISRVFLKYGFGEYIKTFHPAFLLAQLGLGKKRITFRPLAQRLKLALEELGPTFIKIGQIASTRGDLIPEEFTNELVKLQDEVKPEPFSEIKKVIESEIGLIETFFDEFEKEPVGSASIAQVYLARYKGKPVIVKVRRPKIEQIIEIDIDILKMISKVAERNIPAIKEREPEKLIDTFARTIRRELDFLNEANDAERFRENFHEDERIYIPQIYRDISTRKVLIQEHIDGIKISDIKTMQKNGIDPKVVAENGADIFLKQIFVNGFFHADPHPGNIFVKEGNVIALIDFGMVGRINHRLKEQISDFLIGVVDRDPDTIVRALKKIGAVENEIESESLKEDILDILDKLEGRTLTQISISDFVHVIQRTIRTHHIRIPQDLLYLGKSLSQIESIGKELDPNFDTVRYLKKFVVRNHIDVLSIKEAIVRGKWWLKDMLEILWDLPENLNRLFDFNQQVKRNNKPEKKIDKRISWFLSGFGIMTLSIFVFLVTNLPILKIFSILGLVFSFIIFVIQIVISVMK